MAEASSILSVPITKLKELVDMDTNELPQEEFIDCILRGLKEKLNAGLTKLTVKDLEGAALEARKAEIRTVVEKNKAEILAGESKKMGVRAKSATKVPAEVRTEALRLAKAAISQQIKDDGGKISHYAKSDITKWAKELLEADGGYFKLAEEALSARKAAPIKISLSGLKPSEKLVKAAEEKKAKAKAKPTLSAKQASMPAVRQKGAKPTHATAH
jgi:hypothetical protein